MSEMTEREPLEAGLPDGTEPVAQLTDVPTMAPVPIPDGFDLDEPEDLPGIEAAAIPPTP